MSGGAAFVWNTGRAGAAERDGAADPATEEGDVVTAPLLTTHWTDPHTGAEGWLVLDCLVGGAAGGGIRMRPGVTPDEVAGLARVMTRKLRVLNLEAGGAKAGIAYDPAAPGALGVLERFLTVHRPFLAEVWSTSEDLGTRERDILAITDRLGLRTSVHASLIRQPDPDRALERLRTVLALRTEGMEITEAVTGYGVAASTGRALQWQGRETAGVSAVVQGFGTVGAGSAWYLHKMGIRVVAVADRLGVVHRAAGVDVAALMRVRDAWGVIDRAQLPAGHERFDRGDWLDVPADVLVPAAVAGAIDAHNAARVRARLVVEAANLPVTEEADDILHQRGVVVVPDFIANAGGAGVFGAALSMDVPPTVEGVLAYVGGTIGHWTERALQEAARRGVTPRRAAEMLTTPAADGASSV